MTLIADEEKTAASPIPREGDHYLAENSKDAEDRIARTVQTIQRDALALYELWSKVELIPRWQEYVISVTPISDSRSRWVTGDPGEPDGKRIEFCAEITESVPGQRISWRSVTPEVQESGTVTFESTPRGTRVTLTQDGRIPGGGLSKALIGAAKRSPAQVVKENLRHFKQLAEAGEIPSVVNQPHGPRGVAGNIKRWMYGENNPTPSGTSTEPAGKAT